jgi:hypothetical protein
MLKDYINILVQTYDGPETEYIKEGKKLSNDYYILMQLRGHVYTEDMRRDFNKDVQKLKDDFLNKVGENLNSNSTFIDLYNKLDTFKNDRDEKKQLLKNVKLNNVQTIKSLFGLPSKGVRMKQELTLIIDLLDELILNLEELKKIYDDYDEKYKNGGKKRSTRKRRKYNKKSRKVKRKRSKRRQ